MEDVLQGMLTYLEVDRNDNNVVARRQTRDDKEVDSEDNNVLGKCLTITT